MMIFSDSEGLRISVSIATCFTDRSSRKACFAILLECVFRFCGSMWHTERKVGLGD